MFLSKAKKWKGEAIDKEEKLAKAIQELNENLRYFEALGKAQRKLEAEVEAFKRELDNAKDTFSHE